jgi:PAS domain S-box-containing protein
MTVTASPPPFPVSPRIVAGLVLAAGIVASVVGFQEGRHTQRERAEAQVTHRAALSHALIREVLGTYEDALHGFAALFTLDARVRDAEFARAAEHLRERLPAVQAIEWVPLVPAGERAEFEAARRLEEPGFRIFHLDGSARPVPAPEQTAHYPIAFVHPHDGNAAALGYDLTVGPTRRFLEQARQTRQVVVSHAFRLVQEPGGPPGVVLIVPVFRAATAGAAPNFTGFVQGVFRVRDLLSAVRDRMPDALLETMFVDAMETDAGRRVLLAGKTGPGDPVAMADEAEFRAGLHREHPVEFGGRDWRVLFRPPPGWIESQLTVTPLLRAGLLFALFGLGAGLVLVVGRRTQIIRQEVAARTAELAESRRQLASMLDALPGMSYRCTYDSQLTVQFLSEGARELTGWTAQEFLSGVVHFRDCIHPEDLGRVRDATRQALESRRNVEIEYRIRTKSGAEKWVLSRGHGVYDASGALNVFEGLAIDITAQKQAESARLELERKLLEGQKLESLGLLAGGIAHDFNNLLSTILGNASMARLALKPDSGVDDQLRAIEGASLRAAELCRQMLAYAGKGRFVVEPADLSLLVEDLLPLLKISIAHQAALKLELPRGLPAVRADATQIRQIVMNLVLNAADAVADRAGEIVLATGVVELDAQALAGCVAGTDLAPGEYVFLEVRDDGTGMTPEVMARIFDPFFTTKFSGRGLGLSAVLGIVRGHQGALRVESTPGVGSAFRLFLPPQRASLTSGRPVAPGTIDPWRQSGHVLVVDDEEQVRSVLVAMLKVCGFSADAESSGAAAVERFRAHPASFDVVVLDMIMPDMNGEETLRAVRAIRPDVRVLFVSGYSEGDVLGRLEGAQGVAFLAKPFTRTSLEGKLRELLA